MPGRKFSSNGYRYGFNGKEKDGEIKGEGNSYDFGSRSLYDPRLNRFISVDPRYREFVGMSPYAFAGNNPILFIDKDGEGPWSFILRQAEKFGNMFSGNGFRYDFEVKKMKDDYAIQKETVFLIKEEVYKAQALALAGVKYTPKSEVEIAVEARHNILGDTDPMKGTLKDWTPDMYQEVEMYLDAPVTGYADAFSKALAGTGYEYFNSPYAVITGESLGSTPLTTPSQKMDVLVDIIPVSKLMKPLKAVEIIVGTKKGLKGLEKFNDFAKTTKGLYKGEGHQKRRGFGFRKNESVVGAVETGKKATGAAEDGGDILNSTKNGKDDD